MKYRKDIDGLRAIAVLAVVFCHVGLGFTGGYVGVDVFFVISGFLITGLIVKDIEAGKFSLNDFLGRRVRRIVPALCVVTLVTLFVGWMLLLPDAFTQLRESVMSMCLLVSNIHFWMNTGYFSPASEEMPMLHTWSLAVEEQFYLIMPFLLLGLVRLRGKIKMPAVILVLLCGSLGLSVYGMYKYPSATFYLLPTRAWELLVGSILAIILINKRERVPHSKVVMEVLALVGIGLILAPAMFYTDETRFPGLSAVAPVLGSAVVIWIGSSQSYSSLVSKLLACRPLVFIGLISYSLYLWHWPLIASMRYRQIGDLTLLQKCAIVVASIIIAYVSWQLVEKPFRNKKFMTGKGKVMIFATSVFLLILGLAFFARNNSYFDGRLTDQAKQWQQTSGMDDRYPSSKPTRLASIPSGLITIGIDQTDPDILMWGDSHALALLPGLEESCKIERVAAHVAWHNNTAPCAGFQFRYDKKRKDNPAKFNSKMLRIACEGKYRHVILAARWDKYVGSPSFKPVVNTHNWTPQI